MEYVKHKCLSRGKQPVKKLTTLTRYYKMIEEFCSELYRLDVQP